MGGGLVDNLLFFFCEFIFLKNSEHFKTLFVFDPPSPGVDPGTSKRRAREQSNGYRNQDSLFSCFAPELQPQI